MKAVELFKQGKVVADARKAYDAALAAEKAAMTAHILKTSTTGRTYEEYTETRANRNAASTRRHEAHIVLLRAEAELNRMMAI